MGSWKKTLVSFIVFMFVALLIGLSAAQATETTVVVRALAKDAMFIGTSMGGAKILIRDVETGTILAHGMTKGGTGDPVTVMKEPRKRGHPLADASTAKFEASLDLAEPTLVSIEALAPYGQRQAHILVSTQVWLIPGQDILGDGVILEIPGFAVDVLYPQAAERFRFSETKSIAIKANVVMMCGCPIQPEGLWDADYFVVAGIVKHNGIHIDSVPFAYGNKTSTFEASLAFQGPGTYKIQVYAYDKKTGNTGVDTTMFKVQE